MRGTKLASTKAGSSGSTKTVGALSGVVILLAICNAAAKDAPRNSEPSAELNSATSRNELVISIPDRKLALLENGQVVKVYFVAVGAPGTPSPAGHYKIINRIVRPTYYHKGLVIGPGRGNPLGNRWMGLDRSGYGIHGTNEPRSIGHAASHGCIRMGKRDVEDLFSRIRVGDVVEIHSERPAQFAWAFESRPRASAGSGTVAEVKPLSPALRAAIADGF